MGSHLKGCTLYILLLQIQIPTSKYKIFFGAVQATQQPKPQIIAAVSHTLAALLVAAPPAALPELARLAQGLQASDFHLAH